ncbi:4,5-dihydroxyphthalate decarboxylase [Paenibacillus sp. PvR052]
MVMNLVLSAIPSALTSPILNGTVSIPEMNIEGVQAQFVDHNSRRMLRLEFDVAEMSFATYVKAKEEGFPLIGLPIFTGRRFLHPCIAVSERSGIQSVSELAGKKIGIPQYWMTSSVWHRGFLQEEYGLRPESVYWYTITEERMDSLRLPDDIRVERIDTDLLGLQSLLENGEIDAILSPKPIGPSPNIRSTFPDVSDAQKQYYLRTDMIPIMHFVVMREALEQQNPGLSAALCKAFENVKRQAYLRDTSGIQLEMPIHNMTFDQWMQTFERDPYPYGIEQNRRALEIFLGYAYDQGLVSRRFVPEELFVS